MAANRYGQISHEGDRRQINIRFPSNEARLKFQNEFEAYHASHDHEGEVPTFKDVTLQELKLGTGSRTPEDLVKAEDEGYPITLDGYNYSDIHEYHNPRGWSNYFHYRVPTCCAPPILAIDSQFVDASTLQRHELSEIFGDMPADDFQSLIESVKANGFIEPILRIYEGQIIDGWHRFRAAKELALLHKLRFQDYRAEKEGNPVDFVLARNVDRRQLSAGQRAQIIVEMHDRYGHGGNRTNKSPQGDLKTREELSKKAGVGLRTFDRAIAVQKAGESKAVISGKKTAGEVLKAREAKKQQKSDDVATLWKQVNAEIPGWKQRDKETCQYASDHIGKASKSMLIQALRKSKWHEGTEETATGPATAEELAQLLTLLQTDNFPFIVHVREVLNPTPEPEEASEKSETSAFKSKAEGNDLAAVSLPNPDFSADPVSELIAQIEADVSAFRNLYAEHYKKGVTSLSDTFTAGITEYNLFKEGYILSLENPTGGFTDVESLKRIQGVTDRLIKDWTGDRTKAGWIRKCLKTEAEKRTELWEKIEERLPAWKERLPVAHKAVPVENFTQALLIEKFREFLAESSLATLDIGEPGTPLSLEELEKLLTLIKEQRYKLIFSVRNALLTDVDKPPLQAETSPKSADDMLARGDKVPTAAAEVPTAAAKVPTADWKQARLHAESTLVAFGNILKGLHVIDVYELMADILHFYHGIQTGTNLREVSPAQLVQIADFFQPLLLQDVTAWPEYIRNHSDIPKRELDFVSIGIRNKNDDVFELVEFTDGEHSDEIEVPLHTLPEELRSALLERAAQKIYEEERGANA